MLMDGLVPLLLSSCKFVYYKPSIPSNNRNALTRRRWTVRTLYGVM